MSIHTQREPKPTKTDRSIEILPDFLSLVGENSADEEPAVKFLVDAVRERIEAGNAEYGQPLYTHDGRDNKVDWWQEAVDQVVYAHKEVMEARDEDGNVPAELADLYEMSAVFALTLADYVRKHVK